MNSQVEPSLDAKILNYCCCCLKPNCIKDISTEYDCCGDKEVYGNMIKETFDIQFVSETPFMFPVMYRICEECICRTRDANAFKKMVLKNKVEFVELQYKMDSLKQETLPPLTEIDVCDNDDGIDTNCADEKHSSVSEYNASVSKKSHKRKEVTVKNERAELFTVKLQTEVRKKATLARGKAPLLRENSLKLLANSTLCVFQWNKSRFRCYCCSVPFSDISLLREHTNRTHSLEDIEKKIIKEQNRLVKIEISVMNCKICNEEQVDLQNLQQHLSNSHKIQFESSKHLLVPFKLENGPARPHQLDLKCQLCSEKFSKFRPLNIHVNRHYCEQICDICGVGFANLVFLNIHKTRMHRPFKCKSCGTVFSSKTDRKLHEISVHNAIKIRKFRFPCPYCDERFSQETRRVIHLNEKHGVENPEFKCVFCEKLFLTRSLLNNHTKYVHLKDKVRIHACDSCNSCFYTKSDLKRHKLTHSGTKKFTCALCNGSFATKDSMRRHLKRTHGTE